MSAVNRILLCGDPEGIKQLLSHIKNSYLCGIVAASIRDQYFEELSKISIKNRLEFIIQPKFSSPEYRSFIGAIRNLKPDLILVNSYSMIIRDDFLSIAKYGGLNIHGASLPRGRGPHPDQWAILNGDNTLGVTLHEISSTVDAGNIVDQINFPLILGDTWVDIRSRLSIATDKLLERNINKIITRSWSSKAQSDKNSTQGSKRYPTDSRFSFCEPIIDIHNKIRALIPPLPPAFCIDQSGKRVEYIKYHSIWALTNLKNVNSFLDISDERLQLKPIQQDTDGILTNCAALESIATLEISYYSTPVSELQSWLLWMINTRSDAVFFIFFDIVSNNTVGLCSFTHITLKNNSARLDVSFEDQVDFDDRMAEKGIRLALRFACEELKLRKIEVCVESKSSCLVGLFKECGFHVEGELKNADFNSGSWVSHTLMARFFN